MKNSSVSEIAKFVQGDEGYLLAGPHKVHADLEAALRAIEGALLCIGEGNISRAGQLLYQALPKDRRPVR